MTQRIINTTSVALEKDQRITYEKKRFFIFSWYVVARADTIKQDLVITTEEEFGRIFINGKEIPHAKEKNN